MKKKNRKFKSIIIAVVVLFLMNTIGQDAASALQPSLQFARPDFAEPYLVEYGVHKSDKLISLLEAEGSMTFATVENLLEREAFLKRDILDLEFSARQGEILIEISEGMILRIFDPARKPDSPIDTVSAAALRPVQKMNENLSAELLYKEELYNAIRFVDMVRGAGKKKVSSPMDIVDGIDVFREDLEEQEVRRETMTSVLAYIDENLHTIAGFVSYSREITSDVVEKYLVLSEGLPEDWRDRDFYGKYSGSVERILIAIRELALQIEEERAALEAEMAVEEILDDENAEEGEKARDVFLFLRREHQKLAKRVDGWLNDPELTVEEVYLKLLGSNVNEAFFKKGLIGYDTFRFMPEFGAFLNSEYLPSKLRDDILEVYTIEHLRSLERDCMLEIFVEEELNKIFLPKDWWSQPGYGKYIRPTRRLITEVARSLEKMTGEDSVNAAGEANKDVGPGAEERVEKKELMDADIDMLLAERPSAYRDIHTGRVKEIALLLAEKMEIEDEGLLRKIEYAALLHDVGGRPVPVTHEKTKWLVKSLASKGIDIDLPKGYGMEEFYRLKARLENHPDVTEEERELTIHEIQAANSIHVIEKSGIFFGPDSRDIRNAVLFHHNIANLEEYLDARAIGADEKESTLLLASILVAADVIENGINLLRKKFYYGRDEIERPLETLEWLEKSNIPDKRGIEAFKKLFDSERNRYVDEVMGAIAADGALLQRAEEKYLEEAVVQREEAQKALDELNSDSSKNQGERGSATVGALISLMGTMGIGAMILANPGLAGYMAGFLATTFLIYKTAVKNKLMKKLAFMLGLLGIFPGMAKAQENRLTPRYYPPTKRDRLVLEDNRTRDSLRLLSHMANWGMNGQNEEGAELFNYMNTSSDIYSHEDNEIIGNMSYEDGTYSVLNKGIIDPLSDLVNDNAVFRVSKYLIWDIPFADMAVTTWHERGHQIRTREAHGDMYPAMDKGYPFVHFYWQDDGYIPRLRGYGTKEWDTYKLLSLGAGFEVSTLTGDQVRRSMLFGNARYNDSMLFLRTKFDMSAYIVSDVASKQWSKAEDDGWQTLEISDSGGVKDVYGHYYYSHQKYDGDPGYDRNDLLFLSMWNLADPYVYYAVQQNAEYIVTGDDNIRMPAFMPYTRAFLTPEGVRADLGFSFRGDLWGEDTRFDAFEVYLYGVKGGEGDIYGIGGNLYGWRFSDSFRTDLAGTAWYHPDNGWAGSVRVGPTWSIGKFDISVSVGYKDEGYVPGERYEKGASTTIKVEFGKGKKKARRVRRNYFRQSEFYYGVAGLLGAAIAGVGMAPASTAVSIMPGIDAFSLAVVAMSFIVGVSVLAYLWEPIIAGIKSLFKRPGARGQGPEAEVQVGEVKEEPALIMNPEKKRRKATEDEVVKIRNIFSKARTRVGFLEGIEALSEIDPEDHGKILERFTEAQKREVAIQLLVNTFQPSDKASEYDISDDETILRDKMFDIAKEHSVMAHGVEGSKGGIWSLLSIILSGEISGYAPGWGLLYANEILPEINSGSHGPFWVTFDEPREEEWKQAENHNYYIVPREESKDYIVEALKIGLREGVIGKNYFNAASAKVVTYAEFIDILEASSEKSLSEIDYKKERTNHPADKKGLYAGLPEDKKLSINDIMAYTAKVAEEIAFKQKDTKGEFIGVTRRFVAANTHFVGGIFEGENDPVVLRIPIELLENSEYAGVSEWLNNMVRTGILMVELYTLQDPDADIMTAEICEQYGISKSDISIERTKLNTVSLFAAAKDMKKKDIQDSLLFSNSLRNSVIVPVGIKGDPTGIIRGAIFGMRLVHIARNPNDEEFIETTIEQYNNIITSYNMKAAAIGREDILALVEKAPGINILVMALKHIIETLPIEKISAEEIRAIYERAMSVAQAA